MTVSEWAERFRILDSKTSDNPGPWRNDKTPYLVGIMDELCNYDTEEVIFVKPTQVGGTEAILNSMGRIIQQDPSPTMVVYPSDTLGESIKKNRIDPMLHASPELSRRYHETDSSLSELQSATCSWMRWTSTPEPRKRNPTRSRWRAREQRPSATGRSS